MALLFGGLRQLRTTPDLCNRFAEFADHAGNEARQNTDPGCGFGQPGIEVG